MTQNNASEWKIDTGHSEVQFKVKHLGISNVTGTFKQFAGTMQAGGDDFNNARVQCTLEVNSLDTNNGKRDADLKSENFFNAETYPEIRFDGVLQKKEDNYELAGNLTVRDITKPVILQTEFTGTGKGRFNDTRAGFEASGKISRKDFGLTWDILTEAGGFVIGEDIRLNFDIQFIKQ